MKEIRTNEDYVDETIHVEGQDWKVTRTVSRGDRHMVNIRPVRQGERMVYDRLISLSAFERIWTEQQQEDDDREGRGYGDQVSGQSAI